MAIQILQTQDGTETRRLDGTLKEYEVKLIILGATAEAKAEVIKQAIAAVPSEFEGYSPLSVRFDGYDSDGNMEATVQYAIAESGEIQKEKAEPTLSFDCTGGTMHVNYAIKQTCIVGDDLAGLAVGWNGKSGSEMKVDGVDIPTGQIRETYTKFMRMSKITTQFKRTVNSVVGRVNIASFKGWDPGEVMFLGMSYNAAIKPDTLVQVTFNFSVQLSEEVYVNDEYMGDKEGFEYVWANNDTETIDSIEKPTITMAYISQVCKYDDFNKLGL